MRVKKIESGLKFKVYIYDGFVVKEPIHPWTKCAEVLENMAQIQTWLASKIPEIMPAYKVGTKLIMEEARGKRVDECAEHEKQIAYRKTAEVLERIEQLGLELIDYKAGDGVERNVFFDEGSIQLVDFTGIKQVEES